MSGPKIGKIDQSILRENVYSALCDAFTRGEFAPGDVVNLRSLAAQLGTSMTPVREAVRRLVAEGALEDTPSRTLAVPPFQKRRMTDLKLARLSLETLVLDMAMDQMDDATIDALEAVLASSPGEKSGSPDLQQNYDFHFTLYQKSGSAVLLPIIKALWLQYGAYLNLVIKHPDAGSISEHKYHNLLIKALRQKNREAAKTALVADISRSFDLIITEQN